MLKTKFFIIIWALFLIVSFVSCKLIGNDKTEPSTQTQSEQDKHSGLTPESNKITAWLWNTQQDDPIINGFIQANPDFEVDISEGTVGVFGDKTIDLPKLSGSIASGKQPDLFLGWMTAIDAYYSNLFMPVQKYLDIDEELKLEDFDDNIFEGVTFNNKIYFVPFHCSFPMFAYNKKIFEEAGLDINTAPKTWSEFVEYATKTSLKNPNGSLKTIGYEQTNFGWDYWHIAAGGDHYVDETGLNFSWNSPEYIKMFEFVRSIADTYGGNEQLGSTVYSFMLQNSAMMVGSGLSFMAQTFGEDLGISTIPLPDDTTEYYSPAAVVSFLGIPRKAKSPNSGWKLLKYSVTDGKLDNEMVSYSKNPDGYMADYIIHIPTREKFYVEFTEYMSEESMELIKLRDSIVEKANRPYYQTPVKNEMMAYYWEQYPKMLNNEISSVEFVNNMQNFSESLAKDFKEQKIKDGWTFEGDLGIPPEDSPEN